MIGQRQRCSLQQLNATRKMDVLKPEVYWIGSRCYRINPCTTARQPITSNYSENNFPPPGVGGTAGRSAPQQQKPYVEVDDFEGD